MSIRVGWGNEEHTYIYYQAIQGWTLENFLDAADAWLKLVNSVDYAVPTLVNYADTNFVPKNILTHMRRAVRYLDDYPGVVVVMGANTMLQTLFEAIRVVHPNAAARIVFVEHRSEADPYLLSVAAHS